MQTVKDFLTINVEAASQHVLRMSFVSEHEAKTFDTEVVAFWSHLIKRDEYRPYGRAAQRTCRTPPLSHWPL